MLPASARLRRRAEFTTTLRRGRRGHSRLLLVHLVRTGSDEDSSPRVGFIVSRAVGGAVVRNRVLRRLRHLMATRLDVLPPGSRLVVRALPPAADASSAELGQALDYAVAAAARRGERDAAVRPPVAP